MVGAHIQFLGMFHALKHKGGLPRSQFRCPYFRITLSRILTSSELNKAKTSPFARLKQPSVPLLFLTFLKILSTSVFVSRTPVLTLSCCCFEHDVAFQSHCHVSAGLWCKKRIASGTQFGPFMGNKVQEATDCMVPRYVWEVRTHDDDDDDDDDDDGDTVAPL